MTTFGITTETKGSNLVPFNPGISPAVLIKVSYEEAEKKDKSEKFDTLVFHFKGRGDMTGRDYRHVEWAIKSDDPKAESKMNALNVRVKHIYEAYRPCPATGIGAGVQSWKEYFTKIAEQFNTDNDKNPIFIVVHAPVKEGEAPRKEGIAVNILLCYDLRNSLAFPYAPNFIEKDSGIKGKTSLVIDKKYHKLVQADSANASGNPMANIPNGSMDINDFIPSNTGEPDPF